jgi:hypothetical protein
MTEPVITKPALETVSPPDISQLIVEDGQPVDSLFSERQMTLLKDTYYIVYDPDEQISNKVLRLFGRQRTVYEELSEPWLADIAIGITLWHGEFQGVTSTWLRWCDRQGHILPTGLEVAEQERQRAERVAEKLRALGIDPEA